MIAWYEHLKIINTIPHLLSLYYETGINLSVLFKLTSSTSQGPMRLVNTISVAQIRKLKQTEVQYSAQYHGANT